VATLTGTVLRAQGGVYEIETAEGIVEASLRGRVKREERAGDKVVVGDVVELGRGSGSGAEAWTIESVHDRRNVLARRAPGKAPRPKVIVANVDQVLIVFAAARPAPHLRMLDRFLVIAEAAELRPLIVVNKTDLEGEEAARALFTPYERAGYRIIFTAAKQGVGVEAVREAICGQVSALAGPSGVGKSSLLNVVQPGLGLRVAAVSEAVNKGRHTTVTAQLIPLECGGYVADTPGLREVGLWEIDTDQLHFYFPEFAPLIGECRYSSSCTHIHEPGCAIRTAVDAGGIHFGRYDSYRRMMLGEDDEY